MIDIPAIDVSSKDIRCRAVRDIRGEQATVKALTEGSIQYELDNLGSYLIKVQWENGSSSSVSPDEIEIVDADISWH